MEKELPTENESEIYQTFLKDFVVEKTKNKIPCVNIISIRNSLQGIDYKCFI